jgi:hypothetical protein
MPERASFPVPWLKAMAKPLAVLIVAPLALILTLFWLLGQGLHQYPVVVCNEDQGFDMPMAGHINMPDMVLKALDTTNFAITVTASPAEAKRLYDAGAAKLLLSFPAHLTEDMFIKQDDPSYEIPDLIKVEFAEVNPLARLFILGSVARTTLAAVSASGGGISASSLPIPVDLAGLAGGFAKAPAYIFLGIIGFLAWVLTGVLALSAAWGLRGLDRPAGIGAAGGQAVFILAFALAGWVFYLLLSWLGSLILGLGLPAAFFPGAGLVLALTATAAAMAFAAGLHAATPERSRVAIPFLILPLFFGGFLFPVELLPVWLQWLKFLFPPYYGLNAVLGTQLENPLPWQLAAVAAAFTWLAGFWLAGLAGLARPHQAVPAADTQSKEKP